MDPRWRTIHRDGSPFLGSTHPAVITLASGEAQSDVIMGGHRPDGSLVRILINTQPLFRSGESRPYAVVVWFIDITDCQKAEGRCSPPAMSYIISDGMCRNLYSQPDRASIVVRADL